MNASLNRLQSGWVYRGAAVLRATALTADQKSYALTLRRQLVERLEGEAFAVAVCTGGQVAREFADIAHACRRERFRTERAHKRLAKQEHA